MICKIFQLLKCLDLELLRSKNDIGHHTDRYSRENSNGNIVKKTYGKQSRSPSELTVQMLKLLHLQHWMYDETQNMNRINPETLASKNIHGPDYTLISLQNAEFFRQKTWLHYTELSRYRQIRCAAYNDISKQKGHALNNLIS